MNIIFKNTDAIVWEPTDTIAWEPVSDKDNAIQIKWSIEYRLSRDLAWKNLTSNLNQIEWKNLISDPIQIEWKNLISDPIQIEWVLFTELPEPLKKYIAKKRTFAYNVNTGMFLYVSKEEDFDKQGLCP